VQETIRAAREDDLTRLTEIYNHYVVEGPVTFDVRPYTVEERRHWLGQFAATGPQRLLVLEQQGIVRGYAASLRFRAKPAYETSVESTIYLAPGRGGSGAGARLYGALFEALRGEDLHRAYGGITLPNEASIRLHERLGFSRIGVYREVGRKLGRYWDVAWYEKALP